MSTVTIFLISVSFFKMISCCMSNLMNGPCDVDNILSRVDIGSMLHVDFKKLPCRPVEFKGQGPSYWWPVKSSVKYTLH